MDFPLSVTFYSYKGGAGRSVACANVAHQLVHSLRSSTALIDFDIESAGQGYVHEINPAWILGQSPKYSDWVYVQDILAGSRAQGELVDLAPLKNFSRFVPRMFIDTARGEASRLEEAAAAPTGLLMLSRPVAEVSSRSEGFRRELVVVQTLAARLKKFMNVDFLLFDSPSGTQPLAEVAWNWSPVMVLLCRPSRQFLLGTRHFLQRLVDKITRQDVRILLLLAAVPLREEFRKSREEAMQRVRNMAQDINAEAAGKGKAQFCVEVPTLSDGDSTERLVIPEVSRLKWRDEVLSEAAGKEDAEVEAALRAYRRLAELIFSIRQGSRTKGAHETAR